MKYTIGVTATGGGVGQSIIKALRQSDYKIVAFDGENTAAGLYMADRAELIPYAKNDFFIEDLLALCKKHHVDLLFPGMDCELLKLSEARKLFRDEGIQVVVSDAEVINTADDKFLTNQFLYYNSLPQPRTWLTVDLFYETGSYPVILKPKRGGARSKGVRKIYNSAQMPKKLEDNVLQEYIDGDEYTCGTVTLGDKYRGCISMRRILRDGDTYKAYVEKHDQIDELCEKVCKAMRPFGAFNIQLRMRDEVPYVFEFNARCSGTTAARALAGFNEPLMIADYLLKHKEPVYEIEKMSILRYWNELPVKKLIWK